MFEKLKSAFATATKNLSERELKTQDVDSAISDLEFALMDADVAVEAVEIIKSNLRESMVGISVEKKHISEHIQKGLASTVSKMFENAGSKNDLVAKHIEKKRADVFLVVLQYLLSRYCAKSFLDVLAYVFFFNANSNHGFSQV